VGREGKPPGISSWLQAFRPALLACAVLVATDSWAQRVRTGQGPVTIAVKGPLVVGFFPPYSKDEEESDSIVEGLAHVEFALDDISKCLKDKKAVFRLDVTRMPDRSLKLR